VTAKCGIVKVSSFMLVIMDLWLFSEVENCDGFKKEELAECSVGFEDVEKDLCNVEEPAFGTAENLLDFSRLLNRGGAGNKDGAFKENEGLVKALVSSLFCRICVFGSLTTRKGTGAENPGFDFALPHSLLVSFGCILLINSDVGVKSPLSGIGESLAISKDMSCMDDSINIPLAVFVADCSNSFRLGDRGFGAFNGFRSLPTFCNIVSEMDEFDFGEYRCS